MSNQQSLSPHGKSPTTDAGRKCILNFLLLLTLLFPTFALATITKELHFEWQYNTAYPHLAGYKIFKDGVLLVTINNPASLSYDVFAALEEGRYTVFTMKCFDEYGNESALSEPYSIGVALGGNILPTPRITASSTSGVAPHVVGFSSSESTDIDGTINSYEWNFGDGGTSTNAITTHAYMVPGTFTATLTVTDNLDGVAAAHTTITISLPSPGTSPTAFFTATETSGRAPLTVDFDGSSSSDDGVIMSYSWNFGDGATATGAKVSHIFSSVGSFTVKLTVTDDNNDHTSYEEVVTVTYPLADVNHDQVTDLKDLILVLQVLSGEPTSVPVYKDVDVNGDGKIGLEEAIKCLQVVTN